MRPSTVPTDATGVDKDGCCGVLLVNVGTPSAPTPAAIRRYLREFLSDPRVIELPRTLWWPILHGFILPLRPRRLAHAYAQIWREDGSPLLAISQHQAQGIAARLYSSFGNRVVVALAMAYGEPGLAAALEKLDAQGVDRLLLLPLFPQYSGATVGAVISAVFGALAARRKVPELRTINGYHDDPRFIEALAKRVRSYRAQHGRGDHLLISFHGVPRAYVAAGDPYERQCRRTAQRLVEALRLNAPDWSIAFQSRFGKAPWITPYTDVRIAELAASSVRTLDVFCPGFSADCLETLEEVAIRYRALFRERGGNELRLIPSPNDDDAHLDALAALIERHLSGWLFSTQAGNPRP